MIQRINKFSRQLLFWFLIFFALAITFVRLFILGVDGYKTDLENKIYELTSIPVEIGMLRANLRGINPEVILKNIKILAAEKGDAPTIQLEEVRVGIDLAKLIFTRQVLPSSRLTLVGVKLSIIRNKDGSLSIIGLNGGSSKQPFWLLKGGQYEVLKSEISWQDQQNNMPTITFKEVDLLIKNHTDEMRHELHLTSQLPEQYGNKLRVSLDIQGNVLKADNINGRVYVEANDIYFPELLKDFSYLKSDVLDNIKMTDGSIKGNCNIKLWSQWQQSEMVGLSGNVQVKNTTLHQHRKQLDIELFKTEFISSIQQGEWQLGVNYFDLETKKQTWPTAQFNLSGDKKKTHLTSYITQLDLDEVSKLVHFFSPLEKQKQALLSKLGVKGILRNFSIESDLESNHTNVNGVFENIFANAYSELPKLENLTGRVKGHNTDGKIWLATKKGALFFPKLQRQALLIEDLYGQVEWHERADHWKVQSESLVLDTKDIQTETRLRLTIPKNDQSIFMDLQTSFENLKDVSVIPKYYPVGRMKKRVTKWLDKAFVSGQIERGQLLFYGNMDQYPFLKGEGVFEVMFNLADVEFKYSPLWPNITNVDAEVLFFQNSLTVSVEQAKLQKLKMNKATIKIPFLKTSKRLRMRAEMEGKIADALNFLQQTPINKRADKFVEAITTEGNTTVELDLKIPLKKDAVQEVDGVAHIKAAKLTVKSLDLPFSQVTGDLKFTEKGLSSDNLSADALGYPVKVNVNHDDVKTTVHIAGKTDSLQLKQQFSFLEKDFIKDNPADEVTPYFISLQLPKDETLFPEINLKSSLIGIPIGLPGALKKLAEEEKLLQMTIGLNEQEFLPLSMNYNNQLRAALSINKQQKTVHSADIIYGKQEANFSEKKGISIQVDQDFFDASEWLAFIKQPKGENKNSEVELNKVSLKINQLQWKGSKLGFFELNVHHFEDQWSGDVMSSLLKGNFTIFLGQEEATQIDSEKIEVSQIDQSETEQVRNKQVRINKIKASLDELDLSAVMRLNFQEEASSKMTEHDMFLIDLFSKQLLWNGVNLGLLDIKTEKLENGIRFKRINVISNKLKIKLNADWIKSGGYSLTELQGNIRVGDLGDVLSGLDITNDLKGSQASIGITAAWDGLPYQFSLQGIEAKLKLTLKEGRLSSIEPGFGRVLGIVAFEQWMKRLSLDFSDIYKEGLSFNKITGNFKVTEGKMVTNDLWIDAIPAHISIEGEVDLLAKALNHKIKVMPKSSAAIPIAGTIVGGIAGAITQAIDDDYEDGYFFGSSYRVTGQWDNIKVIPLHEEDGLLNKTWKGITGSSPKQAVTK